MAGKRGKSGRKPMPGKYYRFGLRFRPGIDPPELRDLLENIAAAPPAQRGELLRMALISGAKNAGTATASPEDAEIETMLDELFDSFYAKNGDGCLNSHPPRGR